ncbi:hypothetical protein SO694_000273101 [Aureococcus anophagefferens]|uniref:WW domain-containing protein n=1 Tax=Aureococcus anophagefferens TaxID=44056 RepID=A0ABR1FV97_AURAN
MASLVDAPWDNAKTSASNDDDLFERIGAMSIKDLKKFLGERNVTPDASIVEKRELRNLAYQSAGVGPPAKPLPAGWAKFVDPSDGTPYYHCRATGETSWDFPEAPAAQAPADAEAPAAAAPEVAPEAAAAEDAPEEEAKPDEVDWKTLSIKELKLVLHANGLSTKGFAEKNDFVVLGPAFDEGKARRADLDGIIEKPVGGEDIADGGWQIDVFGTKRGRCLDDPSCIRFTPRNMRVNNCGMGSAAVTCMRCGRDNLRHQDLGKWEEGEPHMVNERGEGGEHRGLAPSLLAAGAAPPSLAENFAVVAPYSAGRLSLYGDPRSKMLAFVDWVLSDAGRAAGCPDADPSRVFLFGFSDGATEAVELLTTKRFAGGVVCSYGFTGTLPAAAVSRLADVPVWAFHSADDAIFDVANSDRLVASLRRGGARDVVRYTRYDSDPENVAGSARGHTCGISASKLPEVYDWMLQIHAPG